jgi:hypothetical protein
METVSTMDAAHSALRRAIGRLIAAMMIADRRVSADEIDETARLDFIGLGPLGPLVRDELERATRMPIDVGQACEALRGSGSALVGTVLSVLADVAASDGRVDDDEARLFTAVATRLGTAMCDIRDYLKPEASPPSGGEREEEATDDAAAALRTFGLAATATPAAVDAAYLGLVERYDPAKVVPLGPEFVALAVRKLAALTDSYEIARAAAGG